MDTPAPPTPPEPSAEPPTVPENPAEEPATPAMLPTVPDLVPLPYHREVVRYLQRHAKAVWQHYSGAERRPEAAEAQRLYLLKSTVVLKRESHVPLYELADAVAKALALEVPVELYQGADTGTLNASLLYLPHVARVVFHGPLRERLTEDEMRALLGHELAHHKLWSLDDGTYYAAWQALHGMLGMAALNSVENTLRLYQLSVEVFADRAALAVAGLEASIGTLMKVRTGAGDAKPLDFLDQSRELHAAEGSGSREWTHPEAHIRALALDWYDSGSLASETSIRELLEGPMQLDELDLVRREALATLTERVVGTLLQPQWIRTEAVIGQARQMFDDYEVPAHVDMTPEDRALTGWGDSVRDYLTFVLTDFVGVDPDLEDLPLLRAHVIAEQLGLAERLERAVNRELRKTQKAIRELLEDRDAKLVAAEGAA